MKDDTLPEKPAPAKPAPEKMYLISESLRRGLLNYLISRPYVEVHEGVIGLQILRPAPAPVEPSSQD